MTRRIGSNVSTVESLAALAFEDPICLVIPDRVDESGEHRWHAIGGAQIGSEAGRTCLQEVH